MRIPGTQYVTPKMKITRRNEFKLIIKIFNPFGQETHVGLDDEKARQFRDSVPLDEELFPIS